MTGRQVDDIQVGKAKFDYGAAFVEVDEKGRKTSKRQSHLWGLMRTAVDEFPTTEDGISGLEARTFTDPQQAWETIVLNERHAQDMTYKSQNIGPSGGSKPGEGWGFPHQSPGMKYQGNPDLKLTPLDVAQKAANRAEWLNGITEDQFGAGWRKKFEADPRGFEAEHKEARQAKFVPEDPKEVARQVREAQEAEPNTYRQELVFTAQGAYDRLTTDFVANMPSYVKEDFYNRITDLMNVAEGDSSVEALQTPPLLKGVVSLHIPNLMLFLF